MADRGGYTKYIPVKRKKSALVPGAWDESKKIEVLTYWMVHGDLAEAARQAGVGYTTTQGWKKSSWWKEKKKEIEDGEDDKLDKKLSKSIDKALSQLMDRIDNGDFQYDPRTGELMRVPAKLRDLNTAFNTVMDKRSLLRKQPTKIVEQQTTATQLQDLAKQFAAFVQGNKKNAKIEFVEQEESSEAEAITITAESVT